MKQDNLGDRMKESYENRTRTYLPRRTYTIIRLDGRAFSSYTKGFERPYDLLLMEWMDKTAQKLCRELQGVQLAYVQSDEISLVLTDFKEIGTQAWFNGNVQKMVSVSASIAAAEFNKLAWFGEPHPNVETRNRIATFDSRVFTIPDPVEVENAIYWRFLDCKRNSVQMLAQSMYSQKELHGKKVEALHELIYKKGKNWADYPSGFKNGRFMFKSNNYQVEAFNLSQDRTRLRNEIPRY